VLGSLGRIGHDRCRILRPVADIAILVGLVDVVLILEIEIELVAVIGPGNILGAELVADGLHARRRDRVDGVVRIRVGVGVGAVAEKSWL
jgi:hypothetical protein